MTSLTANEELVNVHPGAFDPSLEVLALKTAASKDYKLSIDIPLDALSIDFADSLNSFALSITNSLHNLHIQGGVVPSQSISASYIKSIYVD